MSKDESARIKRSEAAKTTLRELAEQAILRQIAPATVLVNEKGDILYIHGRTGRYLEPSPGETGVNNIYKMAREGLRNELSMAIHRAVESRAVVRVPGLRVRTNGDFSRINLSVCPVVPEPAHPGSEESSPEGSLYLVLLEDAPVTNIEIDQYPAASDSGEFDANIAHEASIESLRQELRAKEEYLQTANEELETSNEELMSSNEEMQSVNEELQSTNEELETSREELQSVNEELSTVNTELQTKVIDLSRANNDMNNLISGTGIGTVFVDHDLRIMRFTPTATRIINLIQSDIGRPVGHIVSNLVGYDSLVMGRQECSRKSITAGDRGTDSRGEMVYDAHPPLPYIGQRDRGGGHHLCGHLRNERSPGCPPRQRGALPDLNGNRPPSAFLSPMRTQTVCT